MGCGVIAADGGDLLCAKHVVLVVSWSRFEGLRCLGQNLALLDSWKLACSFVASLARSEFLLRVGLVKIDLLSLDRGLLSRFRTLHALQERGGSSHAERFLYSLQFCAS